MVSRRFIPPDSGSTVSRARSVSSANSSSRRPAPDDLLRAGRSSARRSSGCRARSAGGRGCPPGGRGRCGCGSSGPSVSGSMPSTRRVPAGLGRHAGDHPHRGRLPGPVGTEEAEGLPSGDVEVDVVDGDQVTESLREAARRDHRLFAGRAVRRGRAERGGRMRLHRWPTLPNRRDPSDERPPLGLAAVRRPPTRYGPLRLRANRATRCSCSDVSIAEG